MSLELITTIPEFESLKPEWDQLTEETLRSFDWHFAWWNHFGAGQELRLYTHRANGQLTGVLPLFVDRWLGQSRIRFIGSGDTCTDYARLIGSEQHLPEFLKLVVDDLANQKSWDMIELEGVTQKDMDALCSQLEKVGYWSYQRDLEPTWILDLPETWEAFLAGSKKSLKRKIKKANSRLNAPEFRVESSHELGWENAFNILVELHQDRFESMGKPGVFADKRFHGFLDEAGASLHANQKTEILIAFHEDEPLIAQIYLHHPNGPMLYQQGICSAKMNLEPGHLLLTYAVRRAIENKHSMFDMLRGNHAYKPYWGAKPVDNLKIRMVSRRLLPSTLNRSYQMLRGVKHFFSDFAKS